MLAIVAGYHRAGSDGQLTNIGNDIYDLALNLYNSGALHTDDETRAYVLELLDVAEEAWKNFAVNGLFAVSLSRARIKLIVEKGADVEDATDTFLRVNEQALRFNTRRRALVAAVRFGTVASPAVLDRIQTLITATDSIHTGSENAHLHGMLAEFWLRSCRADERSGSTPPWEVAEAAALTAAPLLRPNGVSLDPELEAVVWQAAAAAIPLGERSGMKLERLLRSIGCVAELMVTISTTVDRRMIAIQFASVFFEAAELSVTLGDHAAADLIMEATRRDRVGLLLAELVANPAIANTIRAAALAVTDSNRMAPDAPVNDEDEEENDGGISAERLEDRSAAILDDRAQATTEAERILGPLGALCDPQLLNTMTARRILRQRPIDEPTAVLQLLPLSGVLDYHSTSSRVTVYRRLTWTTGATVHEHLDRVHVPKKMLTGSPGDADLFTHAARYAEALLPKPLLTLLNTVTMEVPARLLVVPTGFFHIPFDYLPIPGGRLIDKAVISLHGSLTSINSLMHIEQAASTAPSLAVYDSVKLGHAEDEYRSIVEHLSDVRRVDSATELDATLHEAETSCIALLAMGVHGTRDKQGWGQAKIMPDGSIVTAADVLRWDVPRLCVLASCHSSLITVDGIELGGFPLALMLRGATTVIGGLFQIPDESTTAIMKHFWAGLGQDQNAVRALRNAKLSWLSQSSTSKRPRTWTGLITYGAATR
ncbi:CHAT domain-containing protein [Rhodococcus sp. 24CO]|uniref:CHAT domain-containing protein n=1 Tax=Rhodococcus sp. 24CO TaxID=3117460 RepID=UPI003D33B9F2